MQPGQPNTEPTPTTPPVAPAPPVQPIVPPQQAPLTTEAPLQGPSPAPQPAPKKSKKKLWVIVAASAVLLAGLIAALVWILPGLTVTKDDYAQAARQAQEVSDKYEEFSATTQGLVVLAGSLSDKKALADAEAAMKAQYAELKAAQGLIGESDALRDVETKLSYDAYNSKAQKFNELVDGYVTSIPLYVASVDECKRINAVDFTNLFDQLDLLTESLLIENKEDAVKYSKNRYAGCLEANAALNKSGTNTFAQVGGVFETMINGILKAYEEQFDDAKAVGGDKATSNYADKLKALEDEAVAKSKAIAEQQKKDGEATNYSEDIASFIALLKKKSV